MEKIVKPPWNAWSKFWKTTPTVNSRLGPKQTDTLKTRTGWHSRNGQRRLGTEKLEEETFSKRLSSSTWLTQDSLLLNISTSSKIIYDWAGSLWAKITTLKDGLRPDIQKAVISTKFDTVEDLPEAALEVEACDDREKKKLLRRTRPD